MENQKNEKCNSNCCLDLKNYGLLFLRVTLGFFMLTHGWTKLSHFNEMSAAFPDPIGFGSTVALSLIVFAEFFCSIALIIGLFTRPATIPLIIGMSVAAFVAHAGLPFSGRELPLLYLSMYVVLLLTGPGKISLDSLIYKRFCQHPKCKNESSN